jgi:alkylation response protein AidB-like acyl-CoA dehydrogenase
MEDEVQTMLLDQATRLISAEVPWSRLRDLLEVPGSFDADLWQQAIELGWPGIAIPSEGGGLGLGLDALAALLQLLGQHTISFPLVSSYVAASALLESGTAADVVAGLASGESIATLALGEAGDCGLLPSVTVSNGKLSGRKAPAAFAAIASHAIVSARDGDTPGLYLVSLDGVERDVTSALDNARAAASLTFADTPVVAVATGWEAVLHYAAVAAVLTAFEQVGGAERCLSISVQYAKERKVFGQPIGAFQAIKHKLADMYQELEIGRGCAIDALDALQGGQADFVSLASMARLGASAAYDFNARECIQTYGGIGVTWEAEPHHHYRRARVLALEVGGAPFWREVLVNGQALEVAR